MRSRLVVAAAVTASLALGALAALAGSGAPAAPPAAPPAADYAAKMAAEHRHDAPTATPATRAAEEEPRGLMFWEEDVYAKFPDGVEVTTQVARSAGLDEGRPIVLLIHEWWGVNENMEAVAQRFAARGFAAMIVDLYEGKKATTPDAAYKLMESAMARPERLRDNLRQAHAWARERFPTGKVGVVGWCFGGYWSLQTALELPEGIQAAVVFYGKPEADLARLGRLKAPFLGLYGGRDQGIPVAGVRALQASLEKLGKRATFEIYPDADHAFANPSGGNYNESAAKDAWEKTFAFLRQELKPDPKPAAAPAPGAR